MDYISVLPTGGKRGASQVQQIGDLMRGRKQRSITPFHSYWHRCPRFCAGERVRMPDWPEGQMAVVRSQDACGGVYLEGHGSIFYNPTLFERVG